MRRVATGCAIVLLALSGAGVASAAPASSSPNGAPSGCQKVSFTGAGGYFSQGNFYTEPGDTVTITTKWCYSNGVITSHRVTDTTDIPSGQDPQISLSDVLNADHTALHIGANGTYDSGVINNTGVIAIVGHVTSSGGHHFRNIPSAGG